MCPDTLGRINLFLADFMSSLILGSSLLSCTNFGKGMVETLDGPWMDPGPELTLIAFPVCPQVCPSIVICSVRGSVVV